MRVVAVDSSQSVDRRLPLIQNSITELYLGSRKLTAQL